MQVVGDAVGDTLYYGKGAGQMPTASSVVADVIDMAVGRAQRTFDTLRLWSGNGKNLHRNRAVTLAMCWRRKSWGRNWILEQSGKLLKAKERHRRRVAMFTAHRNWSRKPWPEGKQANNGCNSVNSWRKARCKGLLDIWDQARAWAI